MRAVVLREGRLEVRETADPVPGPGHLLLRVVSTAICASDVHFMDAICDGRLDPLPCVGKVIGLDGVLEALEATRRSAGPPRVVVHPDRRAAPK